MTSSLPPEEPSLSIKRTDQSAMFGRIVRLCLKELREILRDRRTIITLVLMPLLLYPALSLVFNKFMLSQSAVLDPDLEILVGFDSESDAQSFFGLVETGNAILDSRKATTSDFTSVEWRALELQNAQADLDKGNVDVAIK